MLVSAVGEYTPEEVTTLLDAVDTLETELHAFARMVKIYTNGEALPTTHELRERALSVLANAPVQTRQGGD